MGNVNHIARALGTAITILTQVNRWDSLAIDTLADQLVLLGRVTGDNEQVLDDYRSELPAVVVGILTVKLEGKF